MIGLPRIDRTKCGGCNKNILIHNKLMSCSICKNFVHANCAKNLFQYDQVSDSWQCNACISDSPARYNPFSNLCSDKYDPVQIDELGDISEMRRIHESCISYDIKSFKNLVNLLDPDHDKFSTLFCNIDGNASNFDSFVADIARFNLYPFSFIGIAETNIGPSLSSLYNIPGYTSEYNGKHPEKPKGTGVGLYIKDNLIYSKIEKLCQCSANLETLFVSITNTEKPLTVGVAYRPPSGNESEAVKEFDCLMQLAPDKNLILIGDFNFNLLDTKSSKAFESSLYSNNMIPLISIPTHEKPGCTPSLIDNLLTNSTENLITAGVLEGGVSHHLPIFGIFDLKSDQHSDSTSCIPKYDYCESNLNKFVEELDLKSLNKSNYNESDFEQFLKMIKDKIENVFKVDEENFKKSRRNVFTNPWITPGIISSVSRKEFLYKQWKKSCNNEHTLGEHALYTDYSNFRKKLKHVIKNAKQMYYSKKFSKVHGNMKKTWSLINELRGKAKSSIKASFFIDNNLVVDKRKISNGFNLFFSSIASKLNSKLNSSSLAGGTSPASKDSFKQYLPKRVPGSMFLIPCDASEIENIIKGLQNDKASDIPIILLKRCVPVLSNHLSRFFNVFMESGIFPKILKVGKITPVFKKGDCQTFDNYRPISLLPILGKILEKILYLRLYDFLISQKVIYDKQFGFRSGHSTSHAINFSINRIIENLEKKNHVIGIFIDLSKAFDTIDHEKLLIKLEHYGVRGHCFDILHSYLCNRTQFTDFNGVHSNHNAIKYGVPQGSVLGPLLFLIYINDIVNASELGSFVLFADDTNIFVSGKSEDEVYSNANRVMEAVHQYMFKNLLHINLSKSVYMHFRPGRYNSCARVREYGSEKYITITNHKLSKVNKVRFLGVIIDDVLSWDPQLDHLKSKLNSSIGVIKRIRKFIPKSEYHKLYDSLFKSHLSYCISSWGGVPSYKLACLSSIQKRCVRLLFGEHLSYDHAEFYETCARTRTFENHVAKKNFELENTKPIFNKHKILNLHHLYVQHTFVDLFKIMKDHTPISVYELFHLSPRQSSFKMCLPKQKLELSKQNHNFMGCQIWNTVIEEVLDSCQPNKNNIMVPGNNGYSDLSAPISVIKKRIRAFLIITQSLQLPGRENEWLPMNTLKLKS